MIEDQLALIAAEAAGIGAFLIFAWTKKVKPWADAMRVKVDSTDKAVNGGRMERVEHSLERGSNRMDRLETRIDENHGQVHDRLKGLEEGQRQILNALSDRGA